MNQGVHENGCFSINIPSVAQMKQADYCGMVSGKQKDKSKVFETCFGKTGKIPLIQECPVNLACNVIQTIQLQNMEIFIAEVEETYVSEECLTGGKTGYRKNKSTDIRNGQPVLGTWKCRGKGIFGRDRMVAGF